MLTRRLQILLDDDQYRRLSEEADRRHTSVAAVIRDAVDVAVPATEADRRHAAFRKIFAAPPIDLPDDPADLRRELDEAHEFPRR